MESNMPRAGLNSPQPFGTQGASSSKLKQTGMSTTTFVISEICIIFFTTDPFNNAVME